MDALKIPLQLPMKSHYIDSRYVAGSGDNQFLEGILLGKTRSYQLTGDQVDGTWQLVCCRYYIKRSTGWTWTMPNDSLAMYCWTFDCQHQFQSTCQLIFGIVFFFCQIYKITKAVTIVEYNSAHRDMVYLLLSATNKL